MKRIGIITIQKCDNYGADLQAYALGAKLRSMGYDAENIDYLFYKHPRHLGGIQEKPVLSISFKNRLKEFLFPILAWVRGLKNFRGRLERHRRFDCWFKANVKVGREYRSVQSLYENVPQYDIYMVGSDQVWNPRLYSNIKPYFLDFAPEGARCVSYASSFGVSELSGQVFYKYKQWLKRFTYIGLREKRGADIVNAMALNAEIAHVLDPTLLLTAAEWQKVAVLPNTMPTVPYLLLYDLIESQETVSLAKRVAKENRWPIVRIGAGAYGPGEFIWLFAHAEAVVTNSFHGTVFSILNHKKFWTIIPRGMTNSSRLESLLADLGLLERLRRAEEYEESDFVGDINYEVVDDKLNTARRHSITFLEHALSDCKLDIHHNLPLKCYAVWNRSEPQRAESTSGGIFSLLSERTIARGGIVFGAAFDNDFRHVHHVAADSICEITPLMKSKYVWSDPSKAYKDAISELKKGREVLFSGTPCQIAAIRRLANGIDDKLLTIDFVCHGTPRSDMFASYIEELEKRFGGRCESYKFRDKSMGWNFPRVRARFSGGREYNVILKNDPWYLGFGLNATLRKGCFECSYVSLNRCADFTIGDCWRIASTRPEWDDNKGTSLVLVNSEKARVIWTEILESGKMGGGEYDLDLAQMRNMPLMQRAIKHRMYGKVQDVFDKTASFYTATKYFLSKKLILRAKVVFWVKKIGWFYFRGRQ